MTDKPSHAASDAAPAAQQVTADESDAQIIRRQAEHEARRLRERAAGATQPREAAEAEPAGGEPLPAPVARIAMPDGAKINLYDSRQFGQCADATKETVRAAIDGADAAGAKEDADLRYFREMQAKWQQEVASDPEIGGAKLRENLAIARKVVDSFGGEPVRQALDFCGAGNNPELIRMLVRIGKALCEAGALPPVRLH